MSIEMIASKIDTSKIDTSPAFTFMAGDGHKVACIRNDGTVEVFDQDRVGEAANGFWQAFRHPLTDECTRLRERVLELEQRNAELERERATT